jgi:uncharacterized protein
LIRGAAFPKGSNLIIGVISDTHGLIRPEAISALRESDLIIHAGDVGKIDVLDALGAIAPVIAVKGNIDRGEWARGLPEARLVEAGSVWIYVTHILEDLKIDPAAESVQMVVTGHSHVPSIREQNGIVFLNPGSAGPNRFNLPISVAHVIVSDTQIDASIIRLEISATMKKKPNSQ